MFLLCRASRMTYNLVRALDVFRPTRTRSTSSRNSPRHCTYVYFPAAEELEVKVASPSCKRVASKSAGYDCVNNATVPQGRLRHQRARSAGYDCVNNATVPQGRLRNQRNVAQKPWGGPPSCDPAPLTTSLRGLWVSGNAGTGQWLLRTKGRRPKNRPSDSKGGDPKTDRATKRGGDPKTDLRKEELSKQLGRASWRHLLSTSCRGNCWWDGTYTAGIADESCYSSAAASSTV